jgi:DNA-binding NarL/FixJ family response regulator
MCGFPKISIVIIEGSAMVRERIVALMSRQANTEIVGSAENGMQGLNLCLAQHPDLVVAGIELPDINGLELLRRLRKAQPTGRIVALTDFPFKEARQLCLDCGADYYFDKTTEFQGVIDACNALACQPSSRRALDSVPQGAK